MMKNWMPVMVIAMLTGILACASEPGADAQPNPNGKPADSPVVAIDSMQAPVDSATPSVPQAMKVDSLPKDALLGRISPGKDTAFVPISAKYTSKSGIYLRRDAYAAFEKMHAAAAKDGVTLTIISAMRTFGDQKGIWENKWSGRTMVGGKNLSTAVPDPVERAKAILRYSSMPGSSRHHWGTDMDLNSLENSYFDAGAGKKVYDWLTAHAAEYGYCQPYTVIGSERPHGYQEERWHWSYMPIASRFLAAYKQQVHLEDISGFLGSETAKPLNIIEDYVGGIAPPCRDWR